MTSIIFAVLEIIGIILLVIVGILLFLIMLVLFGGIRYSVEAEKKEEIFISVKVSFIGIIKFIFLMENNTRKSYVRFLFFKILKRDFNEYNFENDVKSNDKDYKKNNESKKFSEEEKYEKVLDEKISEDFQKAYDGSFKSGDNFFDKDDSYENDLKEKIHTDSKTKSFLFSVKNIYKKFIYFKNYPDRDKIIKSTVKLAKDLFFAVKPKKFEADFIVGFEDPSDTGMFIGLMAVIFEFISLDICFCGDFENKVFEGSLNAKGKTNVFKVGVPVLKYIFKEHIWKLIKNRKD